MIRPNAHVAAMAPYALAKLTAPPGYPLLSLSQNESLRPPSPKAIAAAQAVLAAGELYPDPACTALRDALGAVHGIAADRIVCGAGSLDLIAALTRAYAGPDRAVLAPAQAYPFFRTAAEMAGARFDTAPEVDWTADVDALLAAVQQDTTLVFLANPANPTGTRLPASEVARLRDALPDHVLLVIDEAYGEFCDGMDTPSWRLADEANCVVLRTFSKAYGLAGLRVGWGFSPPDVAREVAKMLNPNGVTAVSQAACVAALEDASYMQQTCALTAEARAHATSVLLENGFGLVPSHTNFILLDLKDAQQAADLCDTLTACGVVLRRQQGAGAPQAVRMTIGPEEGMARALEALIAWKKGKAR